MAKPYWGNKTETSNLDRILELMPNSQLSSLSPPPDMSTRTDIAGGLLLPREQPKESKPWYDFSGLPEWDFALPGGPQDAAYQLSELRADMTPGEGQLRSAKRSAAETAKATELFGQGKYLEAIPPSIWAGVEGLDAAASGLGVIGGILSVPIDLARAIKRGTKLKAGEGISAKLAPGTMGQHGTKLLLSKNTNPDQGPFRITYTTKQFDERTGKPFDEPYYHDEFDTLKDAENKLLEIGADFKKLSPDEAVKKLTKPQAIINHGVRNLPTLRKAINQSRKEKHLIPDRSKGADGQFVGAPRGIKSKTQIKKMRAEFDAQVAGGVLGADWYQRVRKFTGDISGGSKEAENRLAEAFALFSAQANPDTNMNWTFQALNNWAAGKGINFPEKVKTGAQARTFLKGMLSDQQIKLGKKTQVYHDSLNRNVKTPITGTNDIWHGRAFGYKNNDGKPFSRGFTPQEHVFLDNETVLAVDRANKRKLGGRSNWNAAEVQAAAWVYAKGKSQFTKYPNKFNGNIDEAIEWAKKTYPEYIDKYSVFGTREDIPGMNTGHLPGVTDADYKTRVDFADDVPGNLGTSTDVITDAVGGYSTGLRDATGVFTSHTGVTEVNPAQANQMFVDLVNDEGGKTISDVSQSMMNAVEGIHGYINMQNGSAWHKFIPFQKGGGVKSSVSNSIQIHTGAPLDESRMRDLAGWAEERGMILSDNGKSVVLWPDPWGSKPALSSAGEEVIPAGGLPDGAKMRRLLEGKKATKTRERAGGWQEELADIVQVDIAEIDRGRVVSGYVDYEGGNKISNSAPENAGRGLRTNKIFEILDSKDIPAVLENIDNSPDFRQLIHDQISRATDWSKKMKTPLREDHMRALEILAEEGFKGLEKL